MVTTARRLDDDWDDDLYERAYYPKKVFKDGRGPNVRLMLTDGQPVTRHPLFDANAHRPRYAVVDRADPHVRAAEAARADYIARLSDAWRTMPGGTGGAPHTTAPSADDDDDSADAAEQARNAYIKNLQTAYRTPVGQAPGGGGNDIERLRQQWLSPGARPGPSPGYGDSAVSTRSGDEGRCRRPRSGLRRVSRQAHQRVAQVIADVLQRLPDAALDARIAAAFREGTTSGDVARLLVEVREATSAAELAAETARKHALDPLVSGDDLKLARGEMESTGFALDRLHEAGKKLAEQIEALKALEADRRMSAEHERVLAERDRLAEEMESMAERIMQIAHLVSRIEACDREIGRLNATAASRHGRIPLVLAGATPAITALFEDVLVWDAFIAVAGLQASPVVSGAAGAKDKLRVKRSASLPAAL